MTPEKVVVDANIAFKALISGRPDLHARFAQSSNAQFYSPKFFLVELFKYKARIVEASGISEEEFLSSLRTLVNRVEFVSEDAIAIGTWAEAHRLCAEVDPKDAPYLALTLHLDGLLWTADTELIAGLEARGFRRFWRR
jgi:predicted nucleic acid-binding protein